MMAELNHDVPVLVGHDGDLDGQRWMIKRQLILGREEDCDISILNRQVSRHHAKITPSENGTILEDLGSKNGTHHNGKLVKESIILKDGDAIQIAFAQQFAFLSSDATLPLESFEIPGIQPINKIK